MSLDLGLRPGQKVRVGNGATVYRLQEIVDRRTPIGPRRFANLGPLPGSPGEVQVHVPLHELIILNATENEEEVSA